MKKKIENEDAVTAPEQSDQNMSYSDPVREQVDIGYDPVRVNMDESFAGDTVRQQAQMNELGFNPDAFQTYKSVLPRLPEIPGWHLIWLSTKNDYDPIHSRMRMGYTPLRYEDAPDYLRAFRNLDTKVGEWEGVIGCREMIAFKIPQAQYQRMMTYYYHDEPNAQEENIKDRVRQIEAINPKIKVQREDGMNFGGKAIKPKFE